MTAATLTASPHLTAQRVPAPAAFASGAGLRLAQDIRPGRIVFGLEVMALGLAALWTSVLVCDVLSGAF